MAKANARDAETPEAAEARRWIQELELAERAQQKWLKRGETIAKLYRRDSTSTKRRFSLLWSNTQILLPAIFSRTPEPVVSRRFKDEDPVARAASEVLERALSFSLDTQDFEGSLRTAVLDYVLVARAVTWERYVPHLGDAVTPQIQVQAVEGAEGRYADGEGREYGADAVQAGEDGGFSVAGEPYEPVEWEESVTDYVNFQDFLHGPARTWGEVPWVARRAYMTRAQLVKRFGKLGEKIPLDHGSKTGGDEGQDTSACRAVVYEIWDKASRKAIWVSRSWSERVLDSRDDPLKLEGFFPCPRPLFGTLANDSLEPTPEYILYQDQAQEIDDLTTRIGELETALKVRGFYPSWLNTDLNALFNTRNNFLIPINKAEALKESGGLEGVIEWFPVDQVIETLRACIELRSKLLADVYEITGISDILRGASDPRETAKAVRIKAQWGSIRVRDRQNEVQRFARDVIRIKAEVIAENFDAETLAAMTGLQLPRQADKEAAQAQLQALAAQAQMTGQPPPAPPPEVAAMLETPSWEDVIGLLRNNALRQFRIDIETDSTLEPNESEEKARATEFIQAVSGLIAQMGPAVEARPELAELAGAMIQFGVRRFRAGRELEGVIDRTMQRIAQAPPAPQGAAAAPEPVDRTAVEVAQIEHQTEVVKQQGEMARAQLTAQVKQDDQRLKVVALQRDPVPQVQA